VRRSSLAVGAFGDAEDGQDQNPERMVKVYRVHRDLL
jgi:hypothetical protein